MDHYKIGLLIFSNSKSTVPAVLATFEKLIKNEDLGVIKAVQLLDRDQSILNRVIDDYKNTNLGMLILVTPNAREFFTYSELEEVGLQNEKYLVTLNLDEEIENNFKKIIQKVKSSPGKPYRGCDSSCS